MKLQHIRSRKACDIIMRKGSAWKGKTMIVKWLPGVPRKNQLMMKPGIYLGTFASAKLHASAVKRNRMRRRCREAFRLAFQKHQDFPSAQLLVTPKIASLESSFELIEADVQTFLSDAHSWLTKRNDPTASSTSR